jgi:plasmid stabilization system protein ParE
MRVVFAERARQDIADIYDSIAAKSPAAAQRVEDAIRLACERIAEFPHASAATDEPGVFRRPLVKYRYAIFYRVRAEAHRIEIVRVIYGPRIKDLHRPPNED